MAKASDSRAQLSQVIRELRKTSYRPRMALLGSRQQMCVHKDISQLGGVAQDYACRAAVASRSCRHYLAVDAGLAADDGEAMDMEDLVLQGRGEGGRCGPCPYFLSRSKLKART